MLEQSPQILNFGLNWLRLLAGSKCNQLFLQVALPMVGSIGLIGNLGENHETHISFNSVAMAHNQMHFILSLNQFLY